jgi:hypothetical protein
MPGESEEGAGGFALSISPEELLPAVSGTGSMRREQSRTAAERKEAVGRAGAKQIDQA